MWEVVGKPKDPGLFGRFEPIDVLIWCDCPRTFTLHDQDGGLCLAHWLDEDAETMRFLVVPVTPKQIEELQRGELTLRESLEQARVYVVDQSNDGAIRSVWLTQIADLPQDALPVPRTMLHRSLEPLLSLKATGETIRPGEIPGSVIKSTVEGAQRAIKCLAEYETDSPSRRGRPSRALQKLYDLPVQETLPASFEVQFRSLLNEPSLFEGLEENERELNEKLMRFELHDATKARSPMRVYEFEADLWDDVYELLDVEETVNVLGIQTSPTSTVRILDLIRPAATDSK